MKDRLPNKIATTLEWIAKTNAQIIDRLQYSTIANIEEELKERNRLISQYFEFEKQLEKKK